MKDVILLSGDTIYVFQQFFNFTAFRHVFPIDTVIWCIQLHIDSDLLDKGLIITSFHADILSMLPYF